MLGFNGPWEQKIAPPLSENCTHCVTKLQYLVLLDLLKSDGGRCRVIITYSQQFEFIFWSWWLMATCLEEPAFKPSCYARNLSAAPSAWPHWRHYVRAHIILMHCIYLAVREGRTRWKRFHFAWVIKTATPIRQQQLLRNTKESDSNIIYW